MELHKLIDRRHPPVQLADQIHWEEFHSTFALLFRPDDGRAACPGRLMVGLRYLKHTFDLSDEDAVAQWVENPLWQYFCGGKFFEHTLPIHPSSMVAGAAICGRRGGYDVGGVDRQRTVQRRDLSDDVRANQRGYHGAGKVHAVSKRCSFVRPDAGAIGTQGAGHRTKNDDTGWI